MDADAQDPPNVDCLTFEVYDFPEGTTPYQLYVKFKKLGQVKWVMSIFTLEHGKHFEISVRCPDLRTHQSEPLAHELVAAIGEPAGDGSSTDCSDASSPPDQQSSKHILNALSDDSLRKIFESPTLDLSDLVSIASVCKRFNAIAVDVFPMRFERDEIEPSVFNGIELWRVEECVRTFGQLITSIDVSDIVSRCTDIVVQLLLKYCKNITNLTCIVHYADTVARLRSLMPTLKQLTIIFGDGDLTELFDASVDCGALEYLHASSQRLMLPARTLPRLTDLTLDDSVCAHLREPFWLESAFFAHNPQLARLSLGHANVVGGAAEILQHLPNITELGIMVHQAIPHGCFGQMKKLEGLRLAFIDNADDVVSILDAVRNAQIAIKRLKIRGVNEPSKNLIDAMSKMESVRLLWTTFLGSGQLVRLAHELKNQQRLVVALMERIGLSDTFREVRELLANGKHLVYISLQFRPVRIGDDTVIDAQLLADIGEIVRARKIDMLVRVNIDDRDAGELTVDDGSTLEALLQRHEDWLTLYDKEGQIH